MTADPNEIARRIRIGSAGWSYPDWKGVVYPKRAPDGFDALRYLAAYLDVIEINNTFYRPLDPEIAKRWVESVRDLPEFRFTAKLYQGLTHHAPREWEAGAVDAARAGFRALADANLLDAVLLQFPFWFEASRESLDHVKAIAAAFGDHRLVLEVRHRSFLRREVLDEIRSHGISFCGADQPQAKTSIPPTSTVTGPLGYFRLHGRNADKWFARGASVAEKYDYLYSPEELAQLQGVVREIAARTERTHLIANNHFLGKGLVNALELKASITGARVDVPTPLVIAYPRLERISIEHEA